MAQKRFLVGTRGLVAVVFVVAVGLGWLTHEHRAASRQSTIVASLSRDMVWDMLNEGTIVGQVARKFLPKRQEDRVRGWIGDGWFDRPTIFKACYLDDSQVDRVVDRLNQLGTVREFHYGGAGLTDRGIARLVAGMPGVNVVPYMRTDLQHYFNSRMGTQTAYGLMYFMLGVLLVVAVLVVLVFRFLIRRLFGRRRDQDQGKAMIRSPVLNVAVKTDSA